jgi:ATP-dependent Clp protease ATP-binding subunit ClpX
MGGRKHPNQPLIKIDTTNILFILGGAFVGLEKIISDRIGEKGIGFAADVKEKDTRATNELMHKVLPEDLHKFGMIPEFLGRIPVVTAIDELTEDELLRILTEPKNALVKQYTRMFEFENTTLTFTEAALRAIAQEAIARGTGARGLRAICERVLTDIMYELPGDDTIAEVVITPEAVRGEQQPTLVLHGTRPQQQQMAA